MSCRALWECSSSTPHPGCYCRRSKVLFSRLCVSHHSAGLDLKWALWRGRAAHLWITPVTYTLYWSFPFIRLSLILWSCTDYRFCLKLQSALLPRNWIDRFGPVQLACTSVCREVRIETALPGQDKWSSAQKLRSPEREGVGGHFRTVSVSSLIGFYSLSKHTHHCALKPSPRMLTLKISKVKSWQLENGCFLAFCS